MNLTVSRKVEGFEPCVRCGLPTCFIINGARTHRGCHRVNEANASHPSPCIPNTTGDGNG